MAGQFVGRVVQLARLHRKAAAPDAAAEPVAQAHQHVDALVEALPSDRTPTKADWQRLSRVWHERLDERIDMLVRLRDRLSGCIGCGCLSMKSCQLYNPSDQLASHGTGPRRVLEADEPTRRAARRRPG